MSNDDITNRVNTLSNSKPPKEGEGIDPSLPLAEKGSLSLTDSLTRVDGGTELRDDMFPSYLESMSETNAQNIINRIKRVERAIDAIAEDEQAKLNSYSRGDGNSRITKPWLSDWRETDPGPSGVITVFSEDL